MDSFTLKRKDFKILITHERSGKIREACRVRGFDAYSNDLVDADDNSRYHFTCDVRDAIKATGFDWDLIIMHPPTQTQRLFSRFINWFNSIDKEIPSTNRVNGSQDFFSRLMNRISN